MPKKDKMKVFGFVAIGAAILLLAFFVLGAGEIPGVPGGKDKITCSVTVKNPVAFNVDFKEVDCARKLTSFCTSLQAFGIFSDKATVIFKAGGFSDSASYKITEASDQTKTLSLCLDKTITSGTMELFDEDGERVETRTVNF